MEVFPWCKYYSVKNDELDNHHKALFDIINGLYVNWLGQDKDNCLESLIEEIVSYSDYHIIAEEQYMREIGYEDIERHILGHREFKQITTQLQLVADKNEPEAIEKLIASLVDWLIYHVTVEDKKYAVQLNWC